MNERSITRSLAKRWCGTWNNYSEEEERLLQRFMEQNCEYACYGKEQGVQGTPHLQIYMRFAKKCRGSFIKRALPKIHFEVCKGTELQNIQYCSKENKAFEIGEPRNEVWKERAKVARTREIIDAYMTMDYLRFREKYPWEALNMKKKLEEWRIDTLMVKEPWPGELKDKNFWVWGPPGTGKSRWARSQCDPTMIYLKAANKWWNGYIDNKHKLVLFEDFPKDAKFLGALMKVWADRYTFTAEIKGGAIFIEPSNWALIVTANYSIQECFEPTDVEALRRRFTEIRFEVEEDIIQYTKIKFFE